MLGLLVLRRDGFGGDNWKGVLSRGLDCEREVFCVEDLGSSGGRKDYWFGCLSL